MYNSMNECQEEMLLTPDMELLRDEWEEFEQQRKRENEAWLRHLNKVGKELAEILEGELPF